jgi:hypothetical protein
VDRKLKHAFCLEAHFGDSKWANVLLHLNNREIPIKENQVDRVQHADGMNPVRRNYPQAVSRASPALSRSQQAHESAEITIGHCSMRRYKSLAGLIINTDKLTAAGALVVHG